MSDSLPQDIDPQERITRYLTNPDWFNTMTAYVTPQAFKPAPPKPPERPIRRTSIYRTEGCQEHEVWTIGDEYVSKLHAQQLPVLARADISAQGITDEDLLIAPHPRPHYRHANIEMWPDDEVQRQAKAAALCRKAKLRVRS
jgi:hypothetical protein